MRTTDLPFSQRPYTGRLCELLHICTCLRPYGFKAPRLPCRAKGAQMDSVEGGVVRKGKGGYIVERITGSPSLLHGTAHRSTHQTVHGHVTRVPLLGIIACTIPDKKGDNFYHTCIWNPGSTQDSRRAICCMTSRHGTPRGATISDGTTATSLARGATLLSASGPSRLSPILLTG